MLRKISLLKPSFLEFDLNTVTLWFLMAGILSYPAIMCKLPKYKSLKMRCWKRKALVLMKTQMADQCLERC